MRNICWAVILVSFGLAVCWGICVFPKPRARRPELSGGFLGSAPPSDLVPETGAARDDCPPGAAWCPQPERLAEFGGDAQSIARLVSPVTARVVVQPAAGPAVETTVQVPSGVWLVPEAAIAMEK